MGKGTSTGTEQQKGTAGRMKGRDRVSSASSDCAVQLGEGSLAVRQVAFASRKERR